MDFTSIFGDKDLKSGEGWVQELQHLVDIAATQLVGHVKTTASAAGMPWGAAKVSNREALERIKEYEDPRKVAKLEQLSDQALITAAIDAIRRRKQAEKNGPEPEPAKLDGEDGLFTPATIQPGFVAGVNNPVPAPPQPGQEAAGLAPAGPVITSIPSQMSLPGLEPMTGQLG